MVGRRSSRLDTTTSSRPTELEPRDSEGERIDDNLLREDDDDDDDDESEEEEDDEPVEPNLATRVRRANAGNRMRALLEDELNAAAATNVPGASGDGDEIFQEEADDKEFTQKEEADVFDSDFGSTDEDEYGDDDDEEAGERRLENEAKAEKKREKAKKKKGFVAPVHPFARTTKGQAKRAAAAKQKQQQQDGQPFASTSATTLDDDDDNDNGDDEGRGGGGGTTRAAKRSKLDRSNSSSFASAALALPMRESSRKSAVEFKRGVKDRLVESEKRRAQIQLQTTRRQEKRKQRSRELTQADLIAEALETEEVNRAALLAFYAAEEDRREQERIAGMRYEIIGPKLTFLSRTEREPANAHAHKVARQAKQQPRQEAGRRRMIEVLGESGRKGWNGKDSTEAPPHGDVENAITNAAAGEGGDDGENKKKEEDDVASSWTRNWLVFDQFEGDRADEYEALFGDHVDWRRRLPIRHDPRAQRCALTGLEARYRDPRTSTPFATVEAYQVINSIVDQHAFVWTDSLGAYTGTSGFGLAREVEQASSSSSLHRTRHATASAAVVVHPVPVTTTTTTRPTRVASTAAAAPNPYLREYANSSSPVPSSSSRRAGGGGGGGQRGSFDSPVVNNSAATPPALPPLPTLPQPPLTVMNGGGGSARIGKGGASGGDGRSHFGGGGGGGIATSANLTPTTSTGSCPQIAPQARSIQMNSRHAGRVGGSLFGSSSSSPHAQRPLPPPPPPPPSLPSATPTSTSTTVIPPALPPLPPPF